MKKALCAALLLTALGATVSAPALADDCGGKLLVSKPMKADGGRVVGYLEFYYNAGNGNNCAVTRHSDSTDGTSLYTSVVIDHCKNEECAVRAEDNNAQDAGYRTHQAGPVRLYGKDKCLAASGRINLKSGEAVIADTRGFCG